MRSGTALRPDQVARGTLAALGRRTTSRPGWLSGLLAMGLAMTPRRVRVRRMQLVMRGMAAEGGRQRVAQ